MCMRKSLALALVIFMILPCMSYGQDRERERPDIKYDVPDTPDINYDVLDNIDITSSPIGVVPLPKELGKTLNGLFTKYTKHVAPNGKPIHIFGQHKVTDLQLARAREILKYHLTDAPGTQYGSDKTPIANRMGDVRATLTYTDTQAHSGAMRPILRKTKLRTQDLYATESPVEGDYEYLNNKARPGTRYSRDASYEEIMHLVHGKGIDDVLPAYSEEIAVAEKRAIDAGIYKYGRPAPHEYIINGFDIYFGLWEHNPQEDGGAFGSEYPYHSKQQMKDGDRPLYDLVEKYWPKYLTYNAYVDPGYEGTFSTVLTKGVDYTFKSMYLTHITLTGDKDTGILGNDRDNQLTGNEGDNVITGGKGNDEINGGEGKDTAVFSGKASEYKIEKSRGKVTVTDSVDGRDGSDVVINIEVLTFKDKTQKIDSKKTHLGGCILMEPTGKVPGDLYQMTGVVKTDEFKPFTKKLTVCGITLVGDDKISDEFMIKVGKTIKAIFNPDGDKVDTDLQEELITNMYKYRTTIPFYKGRDNRFSGDAAAQWDATRSKISACDIIMEAVPLQANEVIEHILHHVTDVGLHYTFPNEWGISDTSVAYRAVQDAIAKEYFDYPGGDRMSEERNRVLIQEYGYWIIFAVWELRMPFFPGNDEEYPIKTGADLKAKLPMSYNLVVDTLPRVMTPPSVEMVAEFFGRD